MGLLSQEFTDATVISIGHRPELAAFHQRKIVLERSRKGAELVDEAGGPQPGSAAPFLEQRGRFLGASTGRRCRGFYPRASPMQPTKEAVTCKRDVTDLRHGNQTAWQLGSPRSLRWR